MFLIFVYNKSIIFSINDAIPKCGINVITGNHVMLSNILTASQNRITIAPAEKDTFKCYFPFKFDSAIKQAELTICLMEWMPPPDGIVMCQGGDAITSHE